ARSHQPVHALEDFQSFEEKQTRTPIRIIQNLWDIFQGNDAVLRMDFERTTQNRISAPIPEGVVCIGDQCFLEDGARVGPGTVLNSQTGPIYLDRDAEIMEGCLVRGPLSLGQGAVVKMGAKIYGATSIGS